MAEGTDAKKKRLEDVFASIDDSRRTARRARGEADEAEREVTQLLAEARHLMLTELSRATKEEQVRVSLCPSLHCETQGRCRFPDDCVVEQRMPAALHEAMKGNDD